MNLSGGDVEAFFEAMDAEGMGGKIRFPEPAPTGVEAALGSRITPVLVIIIVHAFLMLGTITLCGDIRVAGVRANLFGFGWHYELPSGL